MSNEQRIMRLLQAPPETLARIDAVLTGRDDAPANSVRLNRMGEAADRLGVSRATLWRAIQDGRIKAVEVRRGSKRIPESELRRFAEGWK